MQFQVHVVVVSIDIAEKLLPLHFAAPRVFVSLDIAEKLLAFHFAAPRVFVSLDIAEKLLALHFAARRVFVLAAPRRVYVVEVVLLSFACTLTLALTPASAVAPRP